MFRVTIEYIEQDLTMEEVADLVRRKYGDAASVSFSPATTDDASAIEFAIQKLVTKDQLKALFGTRELYPVSKQSIKSIALAKLTRVLDNVLEENERKL